MRTYEVNDDGNINDIQHSNGARKWLMMVVILILIAFTITIVKGDFFSKKI